MALNKHLSVKRVDNIKPGAFPWNCLNQTKAHGMLSGGYVVSKAQIIRNYNLLALSVFYIHGHLAW